MRYTTALTPPGTARPRFSGLRLMVFAALFVVAAVWALYGYAQEAYLGHKLAQQASDLRRENALLAQQNQGYHKDIQAISNGTADEEEARLGGYSRPQEKVYLVTVAPSPTPTAKASPTP